MEAKQEFIQTLLDWSNAFMQANTHELMCYSRSAGISMYQMNVLRHLYYVGPSEVTNFAELTHITPAAASQMIARLVDLKMVVRVESTVDRRVRMVHLTDEGRKMVEGSVEMRKQWLEHLAGILSEEQKLAAQDILKTLLEEVRRVEAGKGMPLSS